VNELSHPSHLPQLDNNAAVSMDIVSTAEEALLSISALRVSKLKALLLLSDAVAALFLFCDLGVVIGSVIARSLFNAPIEWADDIARGLMVASAFFGASSAIARGENPGVVFFVEQLPLKVNYFCRALSASLVAGIAGYVSYHALSMAVMTTGQTTGSGLPLQWTFYPMGFGALFMALFSAELFFKLGFKRVFVALIVLGALIGAYQWWAVISPASLPSPPVLMGLGFIVALCGGLPIGFTLALCALIFNFTEGSIPGVIFAQQMARGIDNFVLLAIPFFILVGYLMQANGMSIRLIELLQRLIGSVRGGLNVVMVCAMVLFSGISGSKMADVAAVGSVLIPAAKRSKQNAGSAVALLAASAVMAETIPPCINLIILGFVANLSIGGLFAAGIVPAVLMAAVLIGVSIWQGTPGLGQMNISLHSETKLEDQGAMTGANAGYGSDGSNASNAAMQNRRMWFGALVSFGLIAMIFIGFKTGFATATEVSAFAALYALVVGALVFRELSFEQAVKSFVQASSRAGLVLFIVATAQSLAFVLTLQQIPHALGELLVTLSATHGVWLFLLLSILILIVMGSVLEGAAALIIFGPLLVPVAVKLGIASLHFGVVLVIAMGIGLFAPPLGLGLYGACLVGEVPIEQTVKPILGYLGLLFICLLITAFIPSLSMALPTWLGY
jgi:tripartite ATP-independent transporter DctM subunit